MSEGSYDEALELPEPPTSTMPARGYSWPPFEPGNTVTLCHGVHSERRLEPLVAPLVAGVLADYPGLARFPESLHAWARAEARCLLFSEYLAEHPPWSDEGQRVASWRNRERVGAAVRSRARLRPRAARQTR